MNFRSFAGRLLLTALVLPGCAFGIGIGGVGFGVGIGAPHAEEPLGLETPAIRIDRHAVAIDVAADLTSDATIETTRTLLTAAGVQAGQRAAMTYDPVTESLDVEEAWVETAGGSRVRVAADQILTRPSAAAEGAPGFVGTRTTTVLFPQLDAGARTYVRWRLTSRTPPSLGFSYLYEPELALPAGEVLVRIEHPASVAIRHAERGGFRAEESGEGARRVLTARLENWPGARREPSMVAAADVVPSFVASTSESWESIGAEFHAAVEPKVRVTPEIQALADRIADGLQGRDAAVAIHRWVARNVRYVAVWLGSDSGWVPHPSDEVLRRGYGDCKDQVVLLLAMLRARGIEAEPVLVAWNRSWRELGVPTPLQFGHCMAYLPEFDTWSNPVNPFADLGVLGQELSGKFVVRATPEGRTARTPEGDAQRNAYRVEHDVELTADGAFVGRTTMLVEGRPAMRLRALLAGDAAPDALAEDLLARTPEGGFGRIESSDPTDLAVPLRCNGVWRAGGVSVSGADAWFTTPVGTDVLSPQRAREFLSHAERRFPVVIGAVRVSWRYAIRVPAGRKVRTPQGCTLENAVGRFASRYAAGDDGRIVVERELRVARDVVSPEDYPMLRVLLEAAIDDARAPLVLEGGAR
jgi:transglutaminase-like putative cysteine protease